MAGLTRDNLTTIATRTGCKVVAAWSTRNAGAMGTVVGVVMHHTGTAASAPGTAPTLNIVQNGRSDLQNALSTYYIDRAGTVYLITEKIAWHAGAGAYRGITDGNGHFLGIEAESDGVTWTQATVDSYVKLVAEICRYLGADVNTWAIRHATWATPPGRKTDFAGLNETDFKARVTARLNGTEDDLSYNAWSQADKDALCHDVSRWVLCRTPEDRTGPWLYDRVAGVDNIVTSRDPAVGNRNMGDVTKETLSQVNALRQAVGTGSSAPAAAVDAAAVAAALAANTQFQDALADKVADKLAARLGNG